MNKEMTVNPVLVKVLLLLSVIVLYILGFNFFFNQISSVLEKISLHRQQITTLQQKAAILSDSTQGVNNFTDGVLIAIPQADSSLLAISQIKSSASNAGLTIDNISYSAGRQIGDNLQQISFAVDVSGNLNSIRTFLSSFSQSAPISTFSSLSIVEDNAITRLSTSVSYYWGPLPTQLPELEKPLVNLSDEDLKLITDLSALKKPSISLSSPELIQSGTDSASLSVPRSNVFELPSQ